MEFFLFLLFLTFFCLVTAVIVYYVKILFFSKKTNYRREELTDIRGDVFRICLDVLESGGNLVYGAGTFLASALFVWLWSLLGSVLGEKGPGPFEHIFHMPIFFLALFFSFPFLKDAYRGERYLALAKPALSGLALGNLASGAVHYGLDRDLFFLFYLLLVFLQIPVLVFLWNREPIFGVSFEESKSTYSFEAEEDWGAPSSTDSAPNNGWDEDEKGPFTDEEDDFGLGEDPFRDDFK
ncbi:hypothetical protein ND861_07240 [Leptospira sp. 2 VSF19]|uniref:Uncharacterized protein n=1 Tax=Leptospira soteropolitanensis TaxID=2950025 RepID=A0AAW5VLI6_9LEPT|nr:hypothetical protein [Leptospira soteropolitanensis]MCW7492789.1 hypothetical protein [Leptospira soteropolitanensis]MCW7500024.1 hypothetical protein [Leptospira soteropolitanensis]MCW7522275.1 hypothetical protein [Leptospira soteropolitanensis]MCW7526131.1 hypothetical protein [Leptospira soteropolitanensis]MCW7529757.1 hypothetical protein [Leptospira soteropolitanensis]